MSRKTLGPGPVKDILLLYIRQWKHRETLVNLRQKSILPSWSSEVMMYTMFLLPRKVNRLQRFPPTGSFPLEVTFARSLPTSPKNCLVSLVLLKLEVNLGTILPLDCFIRPRQQLKLNVTGKVTLLVSLFRVRQFNALALNTNLLTLKTIVPPCTLKSSTSQQTTLHPGKKT